MLRDIGTFLFHASIPVIAYLIITTPGYSARDVDDESRKTDKIQIKIQQLRKIVDDFQSSRDP